MLIHRTLAVTWLLLSSLHPAAQEPPVIPVGLDAYRQWHRWPYQRIGARAYMRSTYDRRGGNEGADASHFLFQLATNFNVTLDVEGPGILYFMPLTTISQFRNRAPTWLPWTPGRPRAAPIGPGILLAPRGPSPTAAS